MRATSIGSQRFTANHMTVRSWIRGQSQSLIADGTCFARSRSHLAASPLTLIRFKCSRSYELNAIMQARNTCVGESGLWRISRSHNLIFFSPPLLSPLPPPLSSPLLLSSLLHFHPDGLLLPRSCYGRGRANGLGRNGSRLPPNEDSPCGHPSVIHHSPASKRSSPRLAQQPQ